MGGEDVKLFGMWASPYAVRVKWALKMKQIPYEKIEEDLANKSSLLLQYNPVHRKVPVFVHRENPIAESLVIVEYIDETWKQNPIMPEDPYERAMARFWAKFVEEKCRPAVFAVFSKSGEKGALQEAQKNLKTLEECLKGKTFFGGETIGFVDIIAGWISFMIRPFEEIVGVTIIEEESMPLLCAWIQEFLQIDFVKECLPPPDNFHAHLKDFYEKRVLKASA